MRILVIAGILSTLALPAAAQEPDRRGTIGVNFMHFASDDRRWPYVGFDGTFRVGRFEVQATYFRDSERHDYGDPEYAWTRTLEWYSGGIIVPLSPAPARIRPHLLTGFQLFRDTTSRNGFPHRRPALYGGLGAEFPLGGRLFARAQYTTLAVYVYEEIYVGHAARMSVGIGF